MTNSTRMSETVVNERESLMLAQLVRNPRRRAGRGREAESGSSQRNSFTRPSRNGQLAKPELRRVAQLLDQLPVEILGQALDVPGGVLCFVEVCPNLRPECT